MAGEHEAPNQHLTGLARVRLRQICEEKEKGSGLLFSYPQLFPEFLVSGRITGCQSDHTADVAGMAHMQMFTQP